MAYEYNSYDTLITTQEVVDYSPVKDKSAASERQDFLVLKEEKLFNKCFGAKFYRELLADKVKYAEDDTGDEQYEVFREKEGDGVTPKVFVKGKFVLHEGRLYEVLKDTDGSQRPSHNRRGEYFKIAKRFKKDAYNFLWERYLRTIIAFEVTGSSLVYRFIKDSPKGLVKAGDLDRKGDYQSVSKSEVMLMKSEYIGDADDLIVAMEKFVADNRGDFPFYKSILGEDCEEGRCGKRRRNHGFNV